ncbi:DUF2075 domain-containing protein [Ignavigranum ruoffiae]|uniref:DUF2075 domain-containing protein n=1 Tax=Ignavigranum ruoffiae TaxID=89093 RepID=UPI0031F963DB
MKTYVKQVSFNEQSLEDFVNQVEYDTNQNLKKYLLNFPTIYIVYNNEKKEYSLYVGETSNIQRRTKQHLLIDPNLREDWKLLSEQEMTKMFIIGNEYFNKSLTLDLENRLMHYLSSMDNVKYVYNRRTNQQDDYFTSEYLDEIFSAIWLELRKIEPKLFPLEQVIRQSAIFKASPFHKLTYEQLDAKDQILSSIKKAMSTDINGQLILVSGAAGSGKTVLISSLFYELFQKGYENTYLLVNHDQQLIVYQQIAERLKIIDKLNENKVSKPTRFINNTQIDEKVDIVLVDEAHLIWTQGKQAYSGNNQMFDLLRRAKVVIAVFDLNQVMAANQYWEKQTLETLYSKAII